MRASEVVGGDDEDALGIYGALDENVDVADALNVDPVTRIRRHIRRSEMRRVGVR